MAKIGEVTTIMMRQVSIFGTARDEPARAVTIGRC